MEHGFESGYVFQLTPKGAAEYWRLKGQSPTTSIVLPVAIAVGGTILADVILLGLLLS